LRAPVVNEESLRAFVATVQSVERREMPHIAVVNAADTFRVGTALVDSSEDLLEPYKVNSEGDEVHYSFLEADLSNEAYWARLTVDRNNNVIIKVDFGGFHVNP
jgi:hypothetical protein